jgi:queuosine biosynthesis protein QueD
VTCEIYKDFTFEAAHRLASVPPDHKCARLHGHSFHVRVVLRGQVQETSGWVQDFADISEAWGPLKDALDHRYLNDVGGLVNPTSENIAPLDLEQAEGPAADADRGRGQGNVYVRRNLPRRLTVLLMVQGATSTMRRLRGTKNLAVLLSSNAHNTPVLLMKMGFPIGVDNNCFSGFDEPAYRRLLGLLTGIVVLWVTAPDVVGDDIATLALFEKWEPVLHGMGFPVALVAQDGLTVDRVPWDRIECLFIGGTDDWKLSEAAVELCREAKRRGKLVHVGRCNSFVRIRAAAAMGADSVDGSQFSWWPDRYIPKGLKWIRKSLAELSRGDCMFGVCPREGAIIAGRKKYRCGPLGQKRGKARIQPTPLFGTESPHA